MPLYLDVRTPREAWPPPTWPRLTRPISPRQAVTASTIASTGWTRRPETIYRLVAAPSAGAASAVQREAHGLVAYEIFEVSEH